MAEQPLRTLLILRHGQAGTATRDYDRPLTERGRRDAQQIGLWLRQQGILPEWVLASAAARTSETAKLCCAQAEVPVSCIHRDPALYLADSAHWLTQIVDIPPSVHTALLIGHNPGISWLASQLCGEALSLATANLVVLTAHGDWNGQWDGTMQLQQVVDPKTF